MMSHLFALLALFCGTNLLWAQFKLNPQQIDESLDRAEWAESARQVHFITLQMLQNTHPADQPFPTEGLALKAGEQWQVVYGHWNDDQFVPSYCFIATDTGFINRPTAFNPTLFLPVLKCTRLADSSLYLTEAFQEFDFERYARISKAGIEVIYLPTPRTDGVLRYGRHARFVFDARTQTPIEEEVLKGMVQEIQPDPSRSLLLASESPGHPGPLAYCFAWIHRKSFATVKLETQNMVSLLSRKEDGKYIWMHAGKR